MRKLILASASPRRRELLAAAGFRFEVRVSAVAENEDPAGDPREMSAGNALAKACVEGMLWLRMDRVKRTVSFKKTEPAEKA